MQQGKGDVSNKTTTSLYDFVGERKLIKLNGKLVDHHSDFKLILCSRNEQLKLPADIVPLINLLNFTVTHAGLTGMYHKADLKKIYLIV